MAGKKTVVIPEFRTQRMDIEIAGISPLLCNRIPEEVLESMCGGAKQGEKPDKPNKTVEQLGLECAYRHPQTGAYVFPSSGLMNALASAAYRVGLTKSAVEVYAQVQIPEEWLEILGPAPRARQHAGRNQGKGLIALNRCEFPAGWHIPVSVSFVGSKLDGKKVGMMFEAAGFAVGIGCWRPEKSGRYGRFRIARQSEPQTELR